MPKKPNRAIVVPEGIMFADKKYKPGQEDELAAVAPQWNLNEMQRKGWLEGDWSNAGLTAEEEAEVVAESVEKAAKPKR